MPDEIRNPSPTPRRFLFNVMLVQVNPFVRSNQSRGVGAGEFQGEPIESHSEICRKAAALPASARRCDQ